MNDIAVVEAEVQESIPTPVAHYFPIVRYKQGEWFPVTTISGNYRDKETVIRETKQSWEDYEIKLLKVML